MTQTITIPVRTYELDSYNHVNNAVYLNYLEYSRMEFLRLVGFDYASLAAEGYMLYVSHVDIHYRYSARLGDILSIEVSPIKLGKLSGVFAQIIRNQDGVVCAEAKVTWGCVDKTGKPSKMPEKYMVQGLIPEKINNPV